MDEWPSFSYIWGCHHFFFFNFSHSDSCVVTSHCDFDVHFPKSWWCQTSFRTFICHLCILFGEVSLYVFHTFSHYICFSFFTPQFWEFFILNISPLSDTLSANIFSQSGVYLLIFLTRGIFRAKLFSFDEIQFNNFCFFVSCFGMKSKKSLPSLRSWSVFPFFF